MSVTQMHLYEIVLKCLKNVKKFNENLVKYKKIFKDIM